MFEVKIISRFREKPKTASAWQVSYLAGAAIVIPVLIGFFSAVLRPILDPASMAGRDPNDYLGMGLGFGAGIMSFFLSIIALVTGISVLRKGERSWVVWLGFVLSVLLFSFWIFMIVGEIFFPH